MQKKRNKYTVILFILSICFVCCSKQNETDIIQTTRSYNHAYNNTIAIDIALNELYEVYSFTYPNRKPLSSESLNSTVSICYEGDTILYLVNFDSESGYAILAADKRMSDRVLAIVDNGYICASEFNQYLEWCSSYSNLPDNYTPEQYPHNELPCPAVTLTCKYALEMQKFLNSNNITGIETGFTHNYAELSRKRPLVMTLWGQGIPFNGKMPHRLGSTYDNGRAPAGCVNIALAQILAYHEYPSNLTVDGLIADWDTLKNRFRHLYIKDDEYKKKWSGYSQIDSMVIAGLIAYIANSTNTLSFFKYSFVHHNDALNFLQELGFENVKLYNYYAEGIIVTMIDNGSPVLIKSRVSASASHGWIIDGYIYQERTTTMFIKSNCFSPSSESSFTDYCYLMHCNFGWSSACDGYYTSGVFDVISGNIAQEYESTTDSLPNGNNYNDNFKVITYDNPY